MNTFNLLTILFAILFVAVASESAPLSNALSGIDIEAAAADVDRELGRKKKKKKRKTKRPTKKPTRKPTSNQFPSLKFVGNCRMAAPCGLCQGDCDDDDDCVGDLVCYQKGKPKNDAQATIPGCSGLDYSKTDWCVVDTSAPAPNDTPAPTDSTTKSPTKNPTDPPTKNPTEPPTKNPTDPPTANPTARPTTPSTDSPTFVPTTPLPTASPTTPIPSPGPSDGASNVPTDKPIPSPTRAPVNTRRPTRRPSPTNRPVSSGDDD